MAKKTKSPRFKIRFNRRLGARRIRFIVNSRHIRRRARKTSKQWFSHTSLHFSKVEMCVAEKVWFKEFAPHVEIEYKQVPNFRTMPRYKKGLWDGNAFYVTFEEHDIELARKFQELWRSRL